MKNLTTNVMIAAAALIVVAGMAQAQTVKVEVPFSFRAGSTLMPAGEYRVQYVSRMGGSVFNLINVDAHRSLYTMPIFAGNVSHAGDPTLTFECAGECTLVKLAPGTGSIYRFPHPSIGNGEEIRVAVIRAVLVR